jgi:hypothetical protein
MSKNVAQNREISPNLVTLESVIFAGPLSFLCQSETVKARSPLVAKKYIFVILENGLAFKVSDVQFGNFSL